MMMKEFEARTGIHPTTDLYRIIEEYYYEFDGDKDEFCKAYKNNDNGLAEEIRNKADIDRVLFIKKQQAEIESLTVEVKKLTKQLEREQEWEHYEDDHNVKQADYDRLKLSGRPWSDEEAKTWICEDFGFDPDKVKILHTVPTLEINRHGQVRRTGEADRSPLYCASDWNYVRFDVARMTYELSNGELRFFYH